MISKKNNFVEYIIHIYYIFWGGQLDSPSPLSCQISGKQKENNVATLLKPTFLLNQVLWTNNGQKSRIHS